MLIAANSMIMTHFDDNFVTQPSAFVIIIIIIIVVVIIQ
jgi:hypothetical protein